MQELTTTQKTLPEQMRSEHKPETGDIYIYNSRGYEEICRLGARIVNGQYVSFEKENWSFIEKKWKASPGDSTVSESSLAEHYRLCLVPFEELVADVEKSFSGESLEDDGVEDASTESLVLLSSKLPDMLSRTEMLKDRMDTIATALNARINEEKKLIEKRTAPLKALVEKTKHQLLNIRRAISIVEIYQGENLAVETLCEGQPAVEDVPVTVRQRILFMDEECAALDEEGQGLDYWTRDRFYEWLKTPAHRDIILPEQKCVVVMKPRRFDKRYSRDFYEQNTINMWNKHSFVFIRNGENVSVIESEDLCIYGSVIPRKADYDKIQDEAQNWHSNAEAQLENINYRCIHFAMVLQGLNDRTELFAPHKEINFLKNVGVQIVFDDENDTLLGNGRLDFLEWLKQESENIRRGSRIVYIKGFSEGEPYRDNPYGYNCNHPKYIGPAVPTTGVYTVGDKTSGNCLSFSYLPGDEVWSSEKGWHKRERRETWLFWRDKVINYDTVTPEILKEYLEDRSQRRYYQALIPMLRKLQLELEKEREYEKHFLSSLSRVLDDRNITYTPEMLQEALKWWKNKVIHIRPISSDDDKAWRMILIHIKNSKIS